MKIRRFKLLTRAVLILFFLSLFQGFSLLHPKELDSAKLTNASATLGNSRLSYRAEVSGTPAAGSTTVDIETTGNFADTDTNHLFRQDTICFSDSGENGCKDQTTYTVSTIVDNNTFTMTAGLQSTLADTDLVIATQSGSLTITFTTVNEIPSDGDILITIPAVNTTGKTCDGIPDTSDATSSNGFDLSTIQSSDISITGCTPANWTINSPTCGDASTDHTIRIDRSTSSCAASTTISVTIDSSPGVINPAPVYSGHTQGTADIYTITVQTRDGSDNPLDEIDVKVAPVEAVFVSATVEEQLTFQVQGITADSGTYCGVTRTASSPDSYAYSVPFGTIATTYAAATHNAVQQLTVTTNAKNGYKVYVEESDQMGRDGATCTGTTPSSGDYTFGSAICIRDTTCNATGCSHTSYQDWGAAGIDNYPGLGYSLENVGSDTDAKFEYDTGGATWNAKQFADVQGGEDPTTTDAEIMTNSGAVDSSDVYVCFRIDVPATQPAGYYYNRVEYTAVPTF